jgi:cytochrome c556
MRKSLLVAVIGALAAGAMVSGATIALAQADVIKERQENRKQTAATMRAIKGIIDAKGPTAGAVAEAAKLKTLEAAFVKLFPAGSDKGETKALPTVWSDMAGFQAASKNAEAAFDKLAVAAGSGDMAALTMAMSIIPPPSKRQKSDPRPKRSRPSRFSHPHRPISCVDDSPATSACSV